MAEQGNLLSDNFMAGLSRMYRDYKRGLLGARSGQSGKRPAPPPRPPIVFLLLEELESGGAAQALILQKTHNPVQIVSIRGATITGGSFNLYYGSPVQQEGPEVSGPVPYDATAGELAAALEECASIAAGSIRVHLGRLSYFDAAGEETEVILGRWIIEFLELPAPELLLPFFVSGETGLTGGPADVKTETHFLVPTSTQETMHAAVPVGTPSSMRPGAIGLAEWYHGVGYCVDALEARHFAVKDEEISS